ncbi:four helix bundle protein [Hymenobacter sp. HSC-4F20]|uniref:four helix bundle protein n=1 Tax=Hymenobacter sp. HSC-4F20 TaxID=2864135 RepID=UPI001C7375AE|nr:four helix bundle protein [Hymenobacter sp. HSC-4F20]MBX0292559.1 four helix bundle protein [Hymenobacter sp. HSC-4F20]
MDAENTVAVKSFAFAVRIVRLCRHLRTDQHEYVLAKQLLRSGTSIGANVEEAVGAISKADFSHKISIAYKEARETNYWLKLLAATETLTPVAFTSIQTDCEELCRILRAILNTTRIKKEKDQDTEPS